LCRAIVCSGILRDRAADRRVRFDVVGVIEAIVFQRVLDPGSERSLLPPFLPSVIAPEADELTGATVEIDLAKVQDDARYDGTWVLRTTTSLPPEQVALAVRGLWRVETAFRTLKIPLALRPPFRSEARVRGHVPACAPATALVRVIEDRLDEAGVDLTHLGQFRM
jgi:hypothetical protein